MPQQCYIYVNSLNKAHLLWRYFCFSLYIELKVGNEKIFFFPADTTQKNVSDFIVENRKVFTAKACGVVTETEC